MKKYILLISLFVLSSCGLSKLPKLPNETWIVTEKLINDESQIAGFYFVNKNTPMITSHTNDAYIYSDMHYTITYSIIVTGKICKNRYTLHVDKLLYIKLSINDTLDFKTKQYFENR